MRRSTKLALVGLLVVGTDQAMHRTVLADGWFMGRRLAPFDPLWFYWSSVCENLAAQGIDVLDLSDALAGAGARTDDSFWAPEGHYSPKGHAVVASAIGEAWLGD